LIRGHAHIDDPLEMQSHFAPYAKVGDRSHFRFAPPPIHFIPQYLRMYSVNCIINFKIAL
jgi:hypothetical protein